MDTNMNESEQPVYMPRAWQKAVISGLITAALNFNDAETVFLEFYGEVSKYFKPGNHQDGAEIWRNRDVAINDVVLPRGKSSDNRARRNENSKRWFKHKYNTDATFRMKERERGKANYMKLKWNV